MNKHATLVRNTLIELQEEILAIDARTKVKEAEQLVQTQVMLTELDSEFDNLIANQKKGATK